MAEQNDLGRFLRARREQLRPADVGLPEHGRRRTPGLRREEVASLAGISVDYLVRLEQGRDRHPSLPVVNGLAVALRLDVDERIHLTKLTACNSAPDSCPMAGGDADADEVPATVQLLLDRLDPTPAVLLGPWHQVLGANDAWRAAVHDLGILDDPLPNLARFVFLDPRARTVYPNWDDVADEQVATLREASIRWRADERVQSIVDELSRVPEFATRWRAHDVARRRRGDKRIHHPVVGELRIAYEILLLPDHTDQRILAWLPADEATAERLTQLTGSAARGAGRLRVVG